MKVVIILIVMFVMVSNVFGDTILHRYYDKITDEEMGTCYSDKYGNPVHNNPNWNCEVISESQKQSYMELKKQQQKKKQNDAKEELRAKRKIIKTKLKGLGLSQQDVDLLVGESD